MTENPYQRSYDEGFADGITHAITGAAEVGAKDYVEPKSSKVIPVIVAAEVGEQRPKLSELTDWQKIIEVDYNLAKKVEARTIERCAQVAEAKYQNSFDSQANVMQKQIAAAIRAMKDSP